MDSEVPKIPRRRQKKYDEIIDEMNVFDDIYFRAMMQGNKEGMEHILNTLLERKDIRLKEDPVIQKDLKNLYGDSMRLDAYGRNAETDEQYDLEVQREKRGGNPKRVRMNSALLDSNTRTADPNYLDLTDGHVIFITESDYYGEEKPYYQIERYVDGKKLFHDGSHIRYVNGTYAGDDAIGRLMHDFRCTNPEEMYSQALRERDIMLKRTKKGREIMTGAMETVWNESREETNYQHVKNLLARGKLTDQEIAEDTETTLDYVELVRRKEFMN